MHDRSHGEIVDVAPVRGTVAVVGLGQIGLPLAVQYAQHNWQVIGCDINPRVVEMLQEGRSPNEQEPGIQDEVARLVGEGRLRATSSTVEGVSQASVVVVIVPVIVNEQKQVDLGTITSAARAVGEGLRPGTLVVFETTLPVGTTSGRLRRALEETSRLTAGVDFHLAYSPERVSAGRISRDLATYPKVVGGLDSASHEAVVDFYSSVLDAPILPMKSTEDAEFVKLIETTYRDVNIALANQYARFADAHGLDVAAAIHAANTQPYSHIHEPGVGVGGHCIPVYPYFLIRGDTGDVSGAPALTLPPLARQVNDGMAEYAALRIQEEIGELAGKAVLILGVAYRGDVHEIAFSSARLLQAALQAHGAVVYVDDPLYSREELTALGYTPMPLDPLKGAAAVEAIVAQAAHSAYRSFDLHPFTACLVVLDGRRALSQTEVEASGMRYLRIGDGRASGASASSAAALAEKL